MKKIIYLADGAPFNSRLLSQQPMGGAETASINFINALARQGFELDIYTTACDTYKEGNCHWKQLSKFTAQHADIVLAHRSPHLLSKYTVVAQKKLLYLHNPAQYLSKWKHRKYIYKHRPDIIFSGQHHATTWPKWLPKTQHIIIPYLVSSEFREKKEREAPPPKAIFTSNPLRSLDWLLDVWVNYIHPQCPEAQLHLYCGPNVYKNLKPQKITAMTAVIKKAKSLRSSGVIINNPVSKSELVTILQQTRTMLYRGDVGESFCLALAEAQSMGVPVVTEGIGACKERLLDKKSGYIARGKKEFAQYAIEQLTNDSLWRTQHINALKKADYQWSDAARLFENCL